MLDVLTKCILGAVAISLQGVAVYAILQPTSIADPLFGFLIWQALAAFTMAWFVLTVLARRQQRLGGMAFAHVFVMCLFLPVGGPVLFLSLMLMSVAFPSVRRPAEFTLIENPTFVTYLISRVRHGMGARLRSRLENPLVSADDRLSAMAAFRTLPPHITGSVLQNLLTDKSEDLRLLAYGIFDTAEKVIMQEVVRAREKITQAATAAELAGINSRLAELHWELIYQNFVRGEMRGHALKHVEQYAREALELNSRDANMWYLLGRCAMLNEKPEKAEIFFLRAQRNQFPSGRLLPWQAEAAFLRGEYTKIPEMLAPVSHNGTVSSTLQPVVRYWTT